MASATKVSIRTVAALAAASMAVVAARVDWKSLLLRTVTGPGRVSRIVVLLVVLANLKNLPLVWHLRVLGAIFKHMEFGTHKFSPTGDGPSSLFQPVITSTRSPLMECDYNLHKSNSTYFSDLDVTRSNLVCCLLRDGIKKLSKSPGVVIGPDGAPAKGRWGIMLGAVQCSFRKEIAPYEPYEMWSRILCWDRKWIYVVTHFVRKGAVKPTGYSLNPPSSLLGSIFGRKADNAAKKVPVIEQMNGNGQSLDPMVPNKAIFASAISKYVMKLGRLTVHPEVVIEASGLLPPRPGGWNTMSGPKSTGELESHGEVTDSVEANGVVGGGDIWDWRRIEAENARGMKFAVHFAALDDLSDAFTGDQGPAVGCYTDIL